MHPGPSTTTNCSQPASLCDADEVYLDVLRQLGPAGRARLGFALSAAGRRLSEAGVRRRHPDYDDRKVQLGAIKLAIGSELFAQVYPGQDVVP